MARLTFTDLERGRECVQWCIREIAPVEQSGGGNRITGAGWDAVVDTRGGFAAPILYVELNNHVDENTRTMFLLKWS
jgi:hypothetical protein